MGLWLEEKGPLTVGTEETKGRKTAAEMWGRICSAHDAYSCFSCRCVSMLWQTQLKGGLTGSFYPTVHDGRKSEQGAWGSGYIASMVQKQSWVSSAHFFLLILSKFRAQGIAPPTADKFFHPSLLRHGNPSQTWPEAHLLGDSQFCRVDKTTTIHICVETFKNNHKEEKMETIVKKNSKIVLKNSQQIISLQQQHRTRQKIRTLENKQA